MPRSDPPLIREPLYVLFGGSGGEVVGPITSGVSDPSECSVDVHALSRSAMISGEIGREGHEGAVAGGARADAVPVEPIGQAVVVDGLSGDSAGEQPSRSVWSVVD